MLPLLIVEHLGRRLLVGEVDHAETSYWISSVVFIISFNKTDEFLRGFIHVLDGAQLC